MLATACCPTRPKPSLTALLPLQPAMTFSACPASDPPRMATQIREAGRRLGSRVEFALAQLAAQLRLGVPRPARRA